MAGSIETEDFQKEGGGVEQRMRDNRRQQHIRFLVEQDLNNRKKSERHQTHQIDVNQTKEHGGSHQCQQGISSLFDKGVEDAAEEAFFGDGHHEDRRDAKADALSQT